MKNKIGILENDIYIFPIVNSSNSVRANLLVIVRRDHTTLRRSTNYYDIHQGIYFYILQQCDIICNERKSHTPLYISAL